MNPENAKILSNLERLVKSERKIMHLVLVHIAEVEKRKIFLELGFSSIYKFLTQHLGYSEDAAYDRMTGARLLSRSPDIVSKLEEGTINLTQLVKLNQCLKQEKKNGQPVSPEKTRELVEQIENKTNFETEKILALALQQAPMTHQRIKPQADDSVRVELTFSAEEYAQLKKAQSLLSHIVIDGDLAKVIVHLAKTALQKRQGKTPPKPENMTPTTQRFRLARKSIRRRLPVAVARAVFVIANNCCQHVHPETQKCCQSKYQLQIDHIVPLARGGTDDITNLRLLCGVHNRFEALRWGLDKPEERHFNPRRI